MSTIHLGIEELIARQQQESMSRVTRHTWRLTDFWRAQEHTHQRNCRPIADKMAQMVELVELGRMQLRWAMM